MEEHEEKRAFFSTLHTLHTRLKDGTFGEILDDWLHLQQAL